MEGDYKQKQLGKTYLVMFSLEQLDNKRFNQAENEDVCFTANEDMVNKIHDEQYFCSNVLATPGF